MSHLDTNYQELWNKVRDRRTELGKELVDLELRVDELRKEAAHLDQVLINLGALCGLFFEIPSIPGMGLTDAIRTVVDNATDRLSPTEIQQELQKKGFSFSNYTQPMASVYKVLSRLTDAKQIIQEKEGGRVFYRTAKEISDEDIPF